MADRLSVVLQAVADAGRDGRRTIVERVCDAAVELLSLDGAGLSLMVDGELLGAAGASWAGVGAVQELQLTLGEGPCSDAWTTGRPVLEPDLAAPAVERWPAFARDAAAVRICAVFALPVSLGAIKIGVLVLYRDRPGRLEPEELARGLVLADLAAQVVLGLQAGAEPGALHASLAAEPPHWAEIHQATGVVSVQLGVSLDEAFVRLRAHAFGRSAPLQVVAGDVVAHRLRLE